MQKIGVISKLPNRYQQLSIIAFAICVSIRYGIIDYRRQRYNKRTKVAPKSSTTFVQLFRTRFPELARCHSGKPSVVTAEVGLAWEIILVGELLNTFRGI